MPDLLDALGGEAALGISTAEPGAGTTATARVVGGLTKPGAGPAPTPAEIADAPF